MSLNTPVLDLSAVVAALASFGGVAGLLSLLRILFLDRLISGLDSDSQNIVLRAVNYALNAVAILLLSLLMGAQWGQPLILATLLAAAGAGVGSHLVYAGAQTLVANKPQDTSPDGTYPVYPAAPEPAPTVAAPEDSEPVPPPATPLDATQSLPAVNP